MEDDELTPLVPLEVSPADQAKFEAVVGIALEQGRTQDAEVLLKQYQQQVSPEQYNRTLGVLDARRKLASVPGIARNALGVFSNQILGIDPSSAVGQITDFLKPRVPFTEEFNQGITEDATALGNIARNAATGLGNESLNALGIDPDTALDNAGRFFNEQIEPRIPFTPASREGIRQLESDAYLFLNPEAELQRRAQIAQAEAGQVDQFTDFAGSGRPTFPNTPPVLTPEAASVLFQDDPNVLPAQPSTFPGRPAAIGNNLPAPIEPVLREQDFTALQQQALANQAQNQAQFLFEQERARRAQEQASLLIRPQVDNSAFLQRATTALAPQQQISAQPANGVTAAASLLPFQENVQVPSNQAALVTRADQQQRSASQTRRIQKQIEQEQLRALELARLNFIESQIKPRLREPRTLR